MSRIDSVLCAIFLFLSSAFAFSADPPLAYMTHCASCHANDGSGRTTSAIGKIPDLRSKAVASLSDEALFNAIAYGDTHKAYAHSFLRTGVSEPELRGIIEYMRSLQRGRNNTVLVKPSDSH